MANYRSASIAAVVEQIAADAVDNVALGELAVAERLAVGEIKRDEAQVIASRGGGCGSPLFRF